MGKNLICNTRQTNKQQHQKQLLFGQLDRRTAQTNGQTDGRTERRLIRRTVHESGKKKDIK